MSEWTTAGWAGNKLNRPASTTSVISACYGVKISGARIWTHDGSESELRVTAPHKSTIFSSRTGAPKGIGILSWYRYSVFLNVGTVFGIGIAKYRGIGNRYFSIHIPYKSYKLKNVFLCDRPTISIIGRATCQMRSSAFLTIINRIAFYSIYVTYTKTVTLT